MAVVAGTKGSLHLVVMLDGWVADGWVADGWVADGWVAARETYTNSRAQTAIIYEVSGTINAMLSGTIDESNEN